MRIVTLLAATAGLLAASAAQAAVIYQTDFEASAYTTGALAGQNGWNVFGAGGAVTVDSAAPISGGQSAKVTGSLAPSQTGPWHTNNSAIPYVTLSADILLTSGDAQRGWQFAALGPGLIGFMGGINIGAGGGIFAITNTPGGGSLGTFSRDTVHRVDILLDYVAQNFDVRVDGSTLATNLAFCGGNAGCTGTFLPSYSTLLFDTFGGGGANGPGVGDDIGYIDNILVQSTEAVPEPAAWALMIMGFGLAGGALRRRRAVPA